jgi:hypothetical protein
MATLVTSIHKIEGPGSAWRASVGVSIMTPCFFFTMESLARAPNTGINQRTGQMFLSQAVAPRCSSAAPTRLSCKIEYFIETTSAYLSGRSAFFTDDDLFDRRTVRPNPSLFFWLLVTSVACNANYLVFVVSKINGPAACGNCGYGFWLNFEAQVFDSMRHDC